MNELLALALLIGFILASVLLIAAGATRLHPLWWVGSVASAILAAALLWDTNLEFPNVPAVIPSDLVAPAVAALVGFLAASDVQVLIGFVLGRDRGGIAPVVAGALVGPMVILAGAAYLGSVLG
jgi:hypothetical protein